MTVIMLSAATLYCLPPVLITANIVLSRVPPSSFARTIRTRPGSLQLLTEIAALAEPRASRPALKFAPQNQKRGFSAALERGPAYRSRVRQSQRGSPLQRRLRSAARGGSSFARDAPSFAPQAVRR